MKVIRLKDIAGKVGVSLTAVSKVLNNRPVRIAEEKRKQILRVARKLNYRPNAVARSMHDKSTKTIGIVVPAMNSLFYPDLIRSIEIQASGYGYKCMICDSDNNPSLECSHLEDMISRWVDAMVIAPVDGKDNLEFFGKIHQWGRPIVFMDRYLPDGPFSFIISDNMEGARLGTRTLLADGVTRMMYLGEKSRSAVLNERLEGVRKELRQQHMTLADRDTIFCDPLREIINRTCQPVMEAASHDGLGKTGVFLESNQFFMGMLDAAKNKGISIPSDLKVIGFDPIRATITTLKDFEALQALKHPVPIIQQDIAAMGELAVEYLVSCIKNKKRPSREMRIPVKLIVPK